MSDLHRAVKYANVSHLRELLNSAARQEINSLDAHGRTPLVYAVRHADFATVRLLLAAGASVNLQSEAQFEVSHSPLSLAVGSGDPTIVAALLDAGADIGYSRNGYDVLLDSVHGRDVLRDARLLVLLRLLIAKGARLDTVTQYDESALRVLSRLGRFDAVRFLLDQGADESQLQWTPLIRAVALGTLPDVAMQLAQGAPLEERDYWQRTAWLVTLQIGDIAKAEVLLAKGVERNAIGRCSKPPLFYAIESHQPAMLGWLLSLGLDAEQSDQFGMTPLMVAVEHGNTDAVSLLLAHGVEVDRTRSHEQTALSGCTSAEIARVLLDAGADPQRLPIEGRRVLLGLPAEPEADLLDVSAADFFAGYQRYFGAANAELMSRPFYLGMIRSGLTAYHATQLFDGHRHTIQQPVWSAHRFGQSLTFLPDGRTIQIGGEHEDSYDDDFCIYNDVFVHEPDGAVHIYGYPEAIFPPTDFHTATLVGDEIFIIGSLGYIGTRIFGATPVYALNIRTLQIRKVPTQGMPPGWIHRHRAIRRGDRIEISGGFRSSLGPTGELYEPNSATFTLDTRRLTWTEGAG